MTLGHKMIGTGTTPVIVLHDWFCDTTSYELSLPYWNTTKYKYIFADLRGYGHSKEMTGNYSAQEVSNDVFLLADSLGIEKFHVIGHSMSGMFVQYMAKEKPERLLSVIATTPVPANGSPLDKDIWQGVEALLAGNDDVLKGFLHFITGNCLNDGFVNFKVKQFRSTATPEARRAYTHTYSETNFAKEVEGNEVPMLVIAGRRDNPAYGPEAMKATLLKWFKHSKMVVCEDSGHFPMQEEPAQYAAFVEQFLQSV